MAEAAGLPPAGGDETRAPTIIGVYCTLTAISIACVAARLYTRFRLLRSPGPRCVLWEFYSSNLSDVFAVGLLFTYLFWVSTNLSRKAVFRLRAPVAFHEVLEQAEINGHAQRSLSRGLKEG